MASKKWWDEDEAERAKKRARKERDLFTWQDAVWEAQLIWDDCRAFTLSLEKRMAHLHDLIDCHGQELDQESQDPEDS